MCDGIFTANTGRTPYFRRSVGDVYWRLAEYGNLNLKNASRLRACSEVCPACGRDMKFARLVEQDREVGLTTFECSPCRVSYTAAAES